MPVSTTQLQQPLGPLVSTGNGRLDELFGGGVRRASCVLIGGFSGTCKTTLACTFALAACNRGERVVYVSFEEAEEALIDVMLSPGIDLRPAMAAERLVFLTTMPETLGVEEHLLHIFRTLDDFQPDHLIVDAISACRRMGSEKAAFDFLVRLTDGCKARGVTCIYTNQLLSSATGSARSIEDLSGMGISSLVDTLLLLEQSWSHGGYERRLLIVKSRGSKHSHTFHPFTISGSGIEIGKLASDSVDLRQQKATT